MDEIKLSDDVFEQIKDFNYWNLTKEQESLIDKLITDKELKGCYEKYGLCKESKGGFGTTFKAVWIDGPIWGWDYYNNQWKRDDEAEVALKCLHNSLDIAADFLKEVESNILVYDSGVTVRCFDPLKRPNANELHNLIHDLWIAFINDKNVDSIIHEEAKEADEINKKTFFPVQLPLSSTSTLSYITHPQAVYTSRLLDFKNLPEPKNADKNDDLEYSDSLKMDFAKLDINSKDESS
ncbi:uncharacterized protein OCT59_004591 [Rhizophagus irregularis]|uniref:uncharacterized protein n=1 Tax=Rhizophagus irregularis TaxID=588596 RepID=UPI00332D4522|nr:hypothetical protein OCT59_004591 [Rhizophagus irregularis]